MDMMSEDAKAILLLCGHLGTSERVNPLTQGEYNDVVQWLRGKSLRPSDLLDPQRVPALARDTGLAADRLDALLKRGVQLGFAVEKWEQSGLWVVCRSDPDYPSRLKTHLKDKAPPILFGAGTRSLLAGGGLAIVGSRDVDDAGQDFARDVADGWARAGEPVVSGGARGVDAIAMNAALEAGGVVIGVLADSLLRRSVSRETRYALADGRLLLISPYHPEAGFNVGNAMGRNKLVYAMADYGLIVSSDHKKGGTWEGAVEELKREGHRPVFVRTGAAVPVGNRKLLELGAAPFPDLAGAANILSTVRLAAQRAHARGDDELPLFGAQTSRPAKPAVVREVPPSFGGPTGGAVPAVRDLSSALYKAILPVLVDALELPATADELAQRLGVQKSQLQVWLKQATDAKALRTLAKPVRFARV